VKAARKDFDDFPQAVRLQALSALTMTAAGARPDVAKPLTGLGAGVWELAIKSRGDAWRVVYAVQIEEAVWVVHAFQKKSTSGIKTPRHEVDLVRQRLKRLKEALK
jgi:phage-related protein